ncbi:hypothetical protein VTH06DRAFT_6551 [Thermothelomyces fergusii]
MEPEYHSKRHKLGMVSGVYIPVCLNILSILMFLRFGLILGQVGLLGMLGLMLIAYTVDFVTVLSLSAIASNGEVKGGGAYYLISRSLGPEFGGSIGILFYLAQVLNTALNVVGLIDCFKLNLGDAMPKGYWWEYFFGTVALVVCTGLCLAGSAIFSKASNALLVVLTVSALSIPLSALVRPPFSDPDKGIEFTGASLATLRSNLLPHSGGTEFRGFETFRNLFGILFPATSGIFAGASMSGDLRNPSKAIPAGTLWAMLSTLIAYLLVILALASSTAHASLLSNANIIRDTNIWPPVVFAGEVATTFFSALMGVIGSAKLMQALARDRLFPGLSVFGKGTKKADEPILAIFLTHAASQIAMFANLNQIAKLISMGYQMTFFVMNLACFLLKIGSAPNFRPAFKFFSWQTALIGSLLSAAAMFFIEETYATAAVCLLVFLFILIHYLSPPKHWGDVSQNLIYHQVRKYLLRLKPEHIKFWRPQIILLINNPRRQTRLIHFCNSLKKGALYILGHVIVTDDFAAGVAEAKLQQAAWTNYISEYSRIKAFVQLTMSPTITWGVRNLVLSAGLGGMRPNIAVMGFYNMDELRRSQPSSQIPEAPIPPVSSRQDASKEGPTVRRRRRGDTCSRILEGELPTDAIRNETMMSATSYMTILEDLALRYRMNVAIGKGFESLETPRRDGSNTKKYIDLWPVQMSAAITTEGKNVVTTNFDTYTLILQLGYILHSVPTWKKAYRLRVIVFVEYESEVEEERGRVEALLEKLRIDAEVLVLYLASGNVTTYETIIHGRPTNPDTENLVNTCLKREAWWKDLQVYRDSRSATASEASETASMSDVTGPASSRTSLFSTGRATVESRPRRHSLAHLSDLPRRPSMSQLGRWGVNMGIHTQNLPTSVIDSSDSGPDDDSDFDSDLSDTDACFTDIESVSRASDADKQSLLPKFHRRKSFAGVLAPTKRSRKERKAKRALSPVQSPYGTISALSRHSSSAPRFSSNLVPPTTITNEDGAGPRIMFAEGETRTEQPTLSRQSSYGRGGGTEKSSGAATPVDKRVSFAEAAPGARSPGRSRRSSASRWSDSGGDASVDIPGLLASYQQLSAGDDNTTGSSYSAQDLALSFNDLPSRAQHLILNELMRQNSSDTAVMLTTLPIPQENTCQSEEESLEYLSNVEVLCNGLPPVLLVFSNHLTVTERTAGVARSEDAGGYGQREHATRPLPGAARSLPSRNEPRSISQASTIVLGEEEPVAGPRYTGVCMEIYHRGFCPFCRRAFGRDSFPPSCPYADCKADLRLCRKYPNRSDAPRAPPRLAHRGLLDTGPVSNDKLVTREASRELTSWRSLPELTVEAPTPTDEQQQPAKARAASPFAHGLQPRLDSPSPPSTSRTTLPSCSGGDSETGQTKPPPSATGTLLVDLDKPLPSLPTPASRAEGRGPARQPPPATLCSSVAERHHHQQLDKRRHDGRLPHIASQMRAPAPASSSAATCASPLPRTRHRVSATLPAAAAAAVVVAMCIDGKGRADNAVNGRKLWRPSGHEWNGKEDAMFRAVRAASIMRASMMPGQRTRS